MGIAKRAVKRAKEVLSPTGRLSWNEERSLGPLTRRASTGGNLIINRRSLLPDLSQHNELIWRGTMEHFATATPAEKRVWLKNIFKSPSKANKRAIEDLGFANADELVNELVDRTNQDGLREILTHRETMLGAQTAATRFFNRNAATTLQRAAKARAGIFNFFTGTAADDVAGGILRALQDFNPPGAVPLNPIHPAPAPVAPPGPAPAAPVPRPVRALLAGTTAAVLLLGPPGSTTSTAAPASPTAPATSARSRGNPGTPSTGQVFYANAPGANLPVLYQGAPAQQVIPKGRRLNAPQAPTDRVFALPAETSRDQLALPSGQRKALPDPSARIAGYLSEPANRGFGESSAFTRAFDEYIRRSRRAPAETPARTFTLPPEQFRPAGYLPTGRTQFLLPAPAPAPRTVYEVEHASGAHIEPIHVEFAHSTLANPAGGNGTPLALLNVRGPVSITRGLSPRGKADVLPILQVEGNTVTPLGTKPGKTFSTSTGTFAVAPGTRFSLAGKHNFEVVGITSREVLLRGLSAALKGKRFALPIANTQRGQSTPASASIGTASYAHLRFTKPTKRNG